MLKICIPYYSLHYTRYLYDILKSIRFFLSKETEKLWHTAALSLLYYTLCVCKCCCLHHVVSKMYNFLYCGFTGHPNITGQTQKNQEDSSMSTIYYTLLTCRAGIRVSFNHMKITLYSIAKYFEDKYSIVSISIRCESKKIMNKQVVNVLV